MVRAIPAPETHVDFDFSPEEQAFEREVMAFIEANTSPDVMDPQPEQLSQSVTKCIA